MFSVLFQRAIFSVIYIALLASLMHLYMLACATTVQMKFCIVRTCISHSGNHLREHTAPCVPKTSVACSTPNSHRGTPSTAVKTSTRRTRRQKTQATPPEILSTPPTTRIIIKPDKLGWKTSASIGIEIVEALQQAAQEAVRFTDVADPTIHPIPEHDVPVWSLDASSYNNGYRVLERNAALKGKFFKADLRSQLRHQCLRELLRGVAYARQEVIYNAAEADGMHKTRLREHFASLWRRETHGAGAGDMSAAAVALMRLAEICNVTPSNLGTILAGTSNIRDAVHAAAEDLEDEHVRAVPTGNDVDEVDAITRGIVSATLELQPRDGLTGYKLSTKSVSNSCMELMKTIAEDSESKIAADLRKAGITPKMYRTQVHPRGTCLPIAVEPVCCVNVIATVDSCGPM